MSLWSRAARYAWTEYKSAETIRHVAVAGALCNGTAAVYDALNSSASFTARTSTMFPAVALRGVEGGIVAVGAWITAPVVLPALLLCVTLEAVDRM